jgi:hypothetical protein
LQDVMQPTVHMIATTLDGTCAALKAAVSLAKGTGAKLAVSARLTTAAEYQLAAERVDEPGTPQALWMSAQLPVHWMVAGPASATVRPEFCWDRDGRWTGFPQRVLALIAGGEYRVPIRGVQALVRAEYRV